MNALRHFRKRVWELETMYDKWIWLLGHMHELEDIPENFPEPLFKRLFLLSELGKLTAEEYEQYIKSLESMGDYDNIINTAAEDAEKRGYARGLAQGEAKGRKEERLVIARKMKSQGMSPTEIASLVGLTEEQVVALE